MLVLFDLKALETEESGTESGLLIACMIKVLCLNEAKVGKTETAKKYDFNKFHYFYLKLTCYKFCIYFGQMVYRIVNQKGQTYFNSVTF